ncbi:spore coat protein [Bacillota bacterium]
MKVQLTTKETMLLKDQKSQEELCVQKYNSYSNLAQDPQLKQLFSSLGQKEQEHLNSINQILGGQIPAMGSQSGMQTQAGSGQSAAMGKLMQAISNSAQSSAGASGSSGSSSSQGSQSGMLSDKDLCSDMLATEKFVSSAYDTVIFECTDPNIRQVLNHIQKEEQEHGEQIFNYMQSHGMYNVQ